jgi:hypothetical protein
MRTTLEIEEPVLAAARAIVEDAARSGHRISLGKAVSTLARRGLQAVPPARRVDGFPVLPKLNPGWVITDELVAEHQDD